MSDAQESLETRLMDTYVHVEAMLQAGLDKQRSTILYSGTFKGFARVGSVEYLILENGDYFGAHGINWGGDARLTSERIYVAHDRVISISESRKETKK